MRQIDLQRAIDYASFKLPVPGVSIWMADLDEDFYRWFLIDTYKDLANIPLEELHKISSYHPQKKLSEKVWSPMALASRLPRYTDVNGIVAIVAYNSCGTVIPFQEICDVSDIKWRDRYGGQWNSNGAKRLNGRWLRHPRTLHEKKWNVVVDDLEPPIRGARMPSALIDAWDDYPIFYQKSWKKHRKHQWKEKRE